MRDLFPGPVKILVIRILKFILEAPTTSARDVTAVMVLRGRAAAEAIFRSSWGESALSKEMLCRCSFRVVG